MGATLPRLLDPPPQSQRTINGTPGFQYEVSSDKTHFLGAIAKKGDTVYALVVGAPKAAFERDEAELRHIAESFKLM